MPIVINLDVMLARNKMKSKDLAAYVGITEQNLSLLKSGKVKGIRFSTLETICEKLNCQPGDILEYKKAGRVNRARSGRLRARAEDRPLPCFRLKLLARLAKDEFLDLAGRGLRQRRRRRPSAAP